MHSIRINKVILQTISCFYRVGLWHRGDEASTKEYRVETFCSVYYFLFFIASVGGAINNEDKDETVFLAEVSTMVLVVSAKLWILIWKQKRILELLNGICVFSIRYDDDLTFFNKKLKGFLNFVVLATAVVLFAGLCEVFVCPFVYGERMLFIKVGFPFDWRNDDTAYWAATIFVTTETLLTITLACSFNAKMWYLMLNCSLRYEILGSELRKMGHSDGKSNLKISEKAKQILYLKDLLAAIDAFQHIRELISELEFFSSKIFLLQLGTSAICIGESIYCLAFGVGINFYEIFIHISSLVYNTADIFSITYFGNEIMLSSCALSYCLFESDWVERPLSTKTCVIIFGEYLKQPHQIIFAKVYLLTLETFKRILNSAYSMFNILQNTKQ